MNKVDHRRRPQLDRQGQGIFDPSAWLEEGEGFLASAITMRAQWRLFKRETDRRMKTGDERFLRRNYNKLVGYPRSSMLLLGYAAEMFLKSALAKAYTGCSVEMFDRDVRTFSHDFVRLARECNFPHWQRHRANLRLLSDMVAGDARYPVTPVEHRNFFEMTNTRTATVWNHNTFIELRRLVRGIRDHAIRVDGDSDNPSSVVHYRWDEDGYIVLRAGGHLWQRVTYRLPATESLTPEEVTVELRETIAYHAPRMGAGPDSFLIVEDVRAAQAKRGRTRVVADPRPARQSEAAIDA